MLWLLTIPAIFFFTFQELIYGDFPPGAMSDGRGFLSWCFLIFVGCFISALISAVPVGICCFIGQLPERFGKRDKVLSTDRASPAGWN